MYADRVSLAVPVMLAGLMLLLLLTAGKDRGRQPTRALVCAVTGGLAALYIFWRLHGAWTLRPSDPDALWIWIATAIDVIGLLDFILFMLLMSRFIDRTEPARRAEQLLLTTDDDDLPDVDVWIATYNEAWSILEKTIVGAINLNWPPNRLHIYVLDDGRRAWL